MSAPEVHSSMRHLGELMWGGMTMASTFEIAGLRAEPGTRAAGWMQIARMPSSGTIGIPVVVLHGKADGPVVVVDAATHGDEYEGTLSLLRLLRPVDPP